MRVQIKKKVFDTEEALGLMGVFGQGENYTLYKTESGEYFIHTESEECEVITLVAEKEAQRLLNEEDEMIKQFQEKETHETAWFLN